MTVFLLIARFLKIYILQGNVAPQLRCSGIFSNVFITNFPQSVLVKKMGKKSVNIWRRYLQKVSWHCLLRRGCK